MTAFNMLELQPEASTDFFFFFTAVHSGSVGWSELKPTREQHCCLWSPEPSGAGGDNTYDSILLSGRDKLVGSLVISQWFLITWECCVGLPLPYKAAAPDGMAPWQSHGVFIVESPGWSRTVWAPSEVLFKCTIVSQERLVLLPNTVLLPVYSLSVLLGSLRHLTVLEIPCVPSHFTETCIQQI